MRLRTQTSVAVNVATPRWHTSSQKAIRFDSHHGSPQFQLLFFCVLRFFGLEQVLTRVTSLYELAHAFPKLSESPSSSHKAVVYFGNRRYNARAPPIQHNCSSRECVWSPWFELSGGCGVKRYMIYLSRAPLNCWQTSCYHTWQAVTLYNWVVESTTRAMRWAVHLEVMWAPEYESMLEIRSRKHLRSIPGTFGGVEW